MRDFKEFRSKNIPLCAAENIMSPLARIPLDSELHERYIMGGLFDFVPDNNFIGSEYLYPFYDRINRHCTNLFGSNYADARSLSGINAITSLLMSLTRKGDKVMLSMPETGAHPSHPEICKRLALEIVPMPYSYDMYNYDILRVSEMCQEEDVDLLVFSPSDILFPPQLEMLDLSEDVLVIYDATQTLGLIGGKVLPNPFVCPNKTVLMGGTHKTLPGPSNGLIMTTDLDTAKEIDMNINPKFLRNTQMHHIASLLLCLIEFENFGTRYSNQIIKNSNLLGEKLEEEGFIVAKVKNTYSSTHQVFILLNEAETKSLYKKAIYHGISLNKKHKKLFHNHGLRLGVQEVTRYGWDEEDFGAFANLLGLLWKNDGNISRINTIITSLARKREIHFTFKDEVVKQIQDALK